jgi:phospholipase C
MVADDVPSAIPTLLTRATSTSFSRRRFLKAAVALGAASVGTSLTASIASASQPASRPKIRQLQTVVVCMQENRSLDHYFGTAPWIGQHGIPSGYSQPDNTGGAVQPYHFQTPSTPDIPHSWAAMHRQWNGGRMDGFYRTGGTYAMGYYTADDLPFYYELFDRSTLCVNFFSSVMGPTYPNRFYHVAGTSGGVTTNRVFGYGVLDYPCILDLLEAAGVTWAVYDLGQDVVEAGLSDNVFLFFKSFANDPRAKRTIEDYLGDAQAGTLPQVSFIIPSYTLGQDEHPPAPITYGMELQQGLIGALIDSPQWERSAYILTYDESGGYFDHVAPPQLDAFGLGFRVPTWVVSPFAKPRHLEPQTYEFASILKFIEKVFDLPTLASVNHRFDDATPVGPNYEAAVGLLSGPPAPPRDGLAAVGNLMKCFDL